MAKLSEEELALLTADERRILEELGDEYDEDNEDPPMEADDDPNEFEGAKEFEDEPDKPAQGDGDDDAPSAKDDGEETDKAADGETDKAAEGEAAPAKEEPQKEEQHRPDEQSTPRLEYDLPDDYEDQLKAFNDQRTKLDVDFDDGELTSIEYRQQLREIDAQDRELRDKVTKSELANDWNQKRDQQEWFNRCEAFLDANPLYHASEALREGLNSAVKKIANSDEVVGMSGQDILEKAHESVTSSPEVAALFDGYKAGQKQDPVKGEEAAVKQAARRDVPPTLNRVPASDLTDTNEGSRFGKLDKLEGLEFEHELQKLSATNPTAYEEYLNS